MSKSNYVGAIILGAAAGLAILKYYNMSKEERQEFIDVLKNKAHDLLDDAENTVDRVNHYFAEIDTKSRNEWVDKLFVARRLLIDLFGSERRYII
jgi:hypothetical protein